MRQRLAEDKVQLDLSLFPVVVLSEQGVLSDPERASVIQALDDVIDRRGRHSLVLDLTRASALPDSQRSSIAEHSNRRTPQICEKRAALAVVVKAPLLNHVPMAAYWLRVSPVPAKVFTEIDQAIAWARAYATRTTTGEIHTVKTPVTGFRIGKR